MAKGKENTNPRNDGDSDFEVETIIGSLDKMHYVLLKEVDEIKERLASMAKQRAEFELIMQKKDEQLLKARKEIEDLNKENEQLKRAQLHLEKCFRRCSVKLKRMPFSELQQEKNCKETVSRPQQEKEIVNTPNTGRKNDNTCDVENKEQHLSVPPGPEFPSPVIQQLTSDGDFTPPVTTFNCVISSGNCSRKQDVVPDIWTQFQTPEHSSRHKDIVPEIVDYQSVYKTEDHLFEVEQTSSLELPGPSTDVFNSSEVVQEPEPVEYQPVQEIKVEQLTVEFEVDRGEHSPVCPEIRTPGQDVQVFQPVDVDTEESWSTQFQPYLISKQEPTGPVMKASQSEPSAMITVYQCDTCPARFSSRNLFLGHKKRHRDSTGLKRHKCTQCDYSTDRNDNLARHLRTHTKEKPYVCQVCQKSFAQIGGLQSHARTHTKKKPYKCEICRKTFYQKCNLNAHMRKHTREKPYVCHLCHKAYSHVSVLKYHLKKHHQDK